jgi:hypothetical protein
MKGVAPAYALDGQPDSLDDPMLFNRFAGIFRAGGEKSAAMSQKRAGRRLVKTNESQKYFFHLIPTFSIGFPSHFRVDACLEVSLPVYF